MRLTINTIVAKLLLFIKKNRLAMALLLIALLFRIINFDQHVTFLGDQGRDARVIADIVTFRHFPAIGPTTSIGTVFLGPFYYYLVAPFLLLWNFNPVGLAYGVLFYSIVGYLLAYVFVVKENRTAALVMLFMVGFSAVNIEFSRFSWNPNPLPIFSFLIVWLTALWWKKPSKIIVFTIFFLYGFSVQLHYLSLMISPLLATVLLTKLVFVKKRREIILNYAVATVGFAAALFPLIWFDIRHGFINSKAFMGLFQQGSLANHSSYIDRLRETLIAFFSHIFVVPLPYLLTVLVLIIFLGSSLWYIKKSRNIFFTINFLSIVCFLLMFALIQSPRYPHYFTPIYIPFYATIGYLVSTITKKRFILFSVLIVAGLYANTNFRQFKIYFSEGSRQVERAEKIAHFIAPKIKNKPFNFASWPIEYEEDTVVYFLERAGLRPADRTKVEITEQMFVICAKEPCRIINSPSWNITMFGKSKIDTIWQINDIKVYKLIHTP
ncbi:MAG: hypothetical protein WC775_03185 [Patescibacteria group bacterium]